MTWARSAQRLEIDQHDLLERQWRAWWAMTVEPEAHPSVVPLELVDAYDTDVALPVSGAEVLAAAIVPHAEAARAWAEWAHQGYRTASAARRGDSYRAYAGTIAEHEREVGRRAHSFELNVEVVPFAAPGRLVDRRDDRRGHRLAAIGCLGVRRRHPPDHRRARLSSELSSGPSARSRSARVPDSTA